MLLLLKPARIIFLLHFSVDRVVEAVDLMKNGRTKDALARLNQALGVDSTNCDALVARGAL